MVFGLLRSLSFPRNDGRTTAMRIALGAAMLFNFLLFFSPVLASEIIMKKISAVKVEASSFEKEEFAPEKAVDGDMKTRWSSQWSDPQWLTLDLGGKATVDKAILYWETAFAKTYQVQVSEDGKTWYIVYSTFSGKEGRQEVSFAPVSARFIRVFGIERATQWGYSLFEFEAMPSEGKPIPLDKFEKFDTASVLKLAKSSPKAYYTIVPQMYPAGFYAKWLTKKQSYWTLVGTRDSFNESLLCEDGTIEPFNKSFSFMPYLYVNGRFITAADCKISLSLEEGYLPIPSVMWMADSLDFNQKLFAAGAYDNSVTYVWYQFENRGTKGIDGKLFITIRPFQANPSWMYGGFTDIFSVEENGDQKVVKVNGRDALLSLTKYDNFAAIDYLRGDIIDSIRNGELPATREAYDPLGAASAALEYRLDIEPGEKKDYLLVIPADKITGLAASMSEKDFFAKLEEGRIKWKEDLNKVQIDIPDDYLVNVFKSNIAYILINKDGAALQPGSRNYKRTWIRDGAEMAVALMKVGLFKEAQEYITWVRKRQQVFSGEVLPMINADGSASDWGKTLKEYDGQGAFIYAIGEYYRFTKDRKFLEDSFPSVIKALKFLEGLRKERLTDEFKNDTGEKRRFYGILPLSVSHEGYAAPGMHSYWDDFWALKGWKDGKEMAIVLGRQDILPWMEKEEAELRKSLLDSIRLTQEAKNIEYIPGCADLGDFDATSTAVSVWPTWESKSLPHKQLFHTLDRYYNETFLPVRMDGKTKKDLTPYEIRTANAYLILGQKEKALRILRYFLTLTRPKEWNHWAEVVHFNYDEPKYVGDMPHSWEGAIYINFVRNLFVYEKDDKLILGAGIDEGWLLREKGVSVANMPTYYGAINYSIQKRENVLNIKVWGNVAEPPANFVFKSPLSAKIKEVILNGKRWSDFKEDQVVFKELPAEITLSY